MTRRSLPALFALVFIIGAASAREAPRAEKRAAPPSEQAGAALEARVDPIFARWSSSSPGCSVAASVGDMPALSNAYGMADLEHDVPNTPDTIFEAGSVAKQFTAAAVLLLATDGKLSLDDPARKYVPELPDYGQPLTIRQMLNHTSGLRDWGSVAAIAGWPRTSRAYTHDHVLDIISRQRSLNFPPGTRWSYSNSGYNLAAIIVSRVSGMPFADFTRQRIFQPIGMTRTSWRDDHRRIVKGRAVSYSDGPDGFRTLMPFEDVHGNGGLLTTVGDLLKWNANFASHAVGDAAFVAEQERPGRFDDGRSHDYGLGLVSARYKGVRQVAHSGSTAGYRAYLARYPDQRISVAVLCNVSSGDATQYANAVADVLLARWLQPSATPASAHALTAPEFDAVIGRYRNSQTGTVRDLVRNGSGVRVERGPVLHAVSPLRFVAPNGSAWQIDGGTGAARVTDAFGSVEQYERVTSTPPGAEQLKALAGVYASDEAEVAFTAVIEGGALVLRRRPATAITLTPLYADAFSSELGTVIFTREGSRVTSFKVVQDRVWDLRFTKVDSAVTTRD
jgi:CubicO group peptidase (beta-lactamase class C family)